MKVTGTILKEAREKQNLSISEVSMSTKINPKMITAIEEGRQAQLPAKTFLKGFVRSYAIYLKLDVDQVMAALQQDLGEKQDPAVDPAAAAAKKEEKVESPAISANPRILKGLATGGVLFLLVMIVTVKGLVEKYEKEKAVDPVVKEEIKSDENLNTATASGEKTAEEAKPVEATAPAAEEVKPAEAAAVAPAVSPEVKAAEVTPTAAPPAKPIEVKAEPKPEVKPEVKAEAKPAPASVTTPPPATVAATTPPPAKPEIKVEAPKPIDVKAETTPAETKSANLKDNEIILEALDKVDITFAVNNGPSVRLSLQPAQVHTIKAKGQVAMDVSDGGAVNVIHNGQDNGTLGDLGKPKKVRYP